MADYISGIKSIKASQSQVYSKLSDLTGLASIGEALKHHPEASKVTIEAIDADNCAFVIAGAGKLHLRITERTPEKTIKLESVDAPMDITLWIQLVPADAYDTRLRLTLRTELNFIMKKMIGGKLQDGVEKLADMMAMIPYQML